MWQRLNRLMGYHSHTSPLFIIGSPTAMDIGGIVGHHTCLKKNYLSMTQIQCHAYYV
jgi:hypothetical protein